MLSGLLTKLNDSILATGEPAIMHQLCQIWSEKGIGEEAISQSIKALPELVIDGGVKSESVSLLQRYYSQGDSTNGSPALPSPYIAVNFGEK